MLILILTGCSKDDTPKSIEQVPDPLKITEYNGEVIGYDDKGRLTSWVNYQFEYDEAGKMIRRTPYEYTYNNSGSLSKIKADDSKTITYSYDEKDRIDVINIVKFGNINYTLSYYFEYDENNVLQSILEDNSYPTVIRFNRKSFSYDSQGNVIEILSQESNDNMTFTKTFKAEYSYDDKKNPVHLALTSLGLDTTPVLDFSLMGSGTLRLFSEGLFMISGNNITSYKETDLTTNVSDYNMKYTYTYNEEGYPLNVIRVIEWKGNKSEYIIIWKYE